MPARKDAARQSSDCVVNALRAVRQFLDMEVAFVSAFDHGIRTFTHVDTSLEEPPLHAGMSMSIDTGYCHRVVSGRLPELIPDTSKVADAMDIPETLAIPIRAHVSVPLTFSDGSIYGTFCCFSSAADPTLNDRDLQVMKTVAHMVAFHLEADIDATRKHAEKRARIKQAIASGQPLVHYQPVIDFRTGKVVGAEALGRFQSDPAFSPDQWFSDAADVDLRSELETAAIRNALAGFSALLLETNLHLAVNIGPLLSIEGGKDGLLNIFDGFPLDRLIVEITEHAIVKDYELLEQCLEPLRSGGAKIAADDVGAGFANMRHVMKLRPDIIKLDTTITDAIASDPVQRAIVSAIMEFSRHTGSEVLAEGVETEAQYEILRDAGVHMGQGYFIGRPGSIEQLVAAYGARDR
jgi:EAL domain-containing protein (putative c-di-GMP-specific phosphodiesterase class I)